MSASRVRVRTEGHAYRKLTIPSPASVWKSSVEGGVKSSSVVSWILLRVSIFSGGRCEIIIGGQLDPPEGEYLQWREVWNHHRWWAGSSWGWVSSVEGGVKSSSVVSWTLLRMSIFSGGRCEIIIGGELNPPEGEYLQWREVWNHHQWWVGSSWGWVSSVEVWIIIGGELDPPEGEYPQWREAWIIIGGELDPPEGEYLQWREVWNHHRWWAGSSWGWVSSVEVWIIIGGELAPPEGEYPQWREAWIIIGGELDPPAMSNVMESKVWSSMSNRRGLGLHRILHSCVTVSGHSQ